MEILKFIVQNICGANRLIFKGRAVGWCRGIMAFQLWLTFFSTSVFALGKARGPEELPKPVHPFPNSRVLEEAYDPRVELVSETLERGSCVSSCQVSSVQIRGVDPVNRKNRAIDLQVYRPTSEGGQLGSVIIVPPIYGVTTLDTWNAQNFCNAGLRVAVLQKWEFYADSGVDWGLHDRGTLRAVTAIRHALEYLLSERQGPVGLLGTSLGAISSSLALSVEPRLTTGVLIVGGGPVYEILAKSSIQDSQKLREVRMRNDHLNSVEEYEQRLSESIQIDTIQYALQAAPKSLWMFIATTDTVVPASTQWQLWQAWQKPKVTQARLDHLGMIVYAFSFWRYSILDYFVEHLLHH